MSHIKQLCRLCKDTESLQDLTTDQCASLAAKAQFCVGLEMHPDDELPKMICKHCTKKVKKFYRFKLKCIQVHEELLLELENAVEDKTELSTTLNDFCESFYFDPLESCSIQFDDENLSTDKISDLEIDIPIDESELETTLKEDTKQSTKKSNSDIQCDQCGALFQKKIEFKRHIVTHNTKLFQCKYCPKQFTRAETSRIHMRSHLGIKPYMCDMCGQSSTKRQDLIRHMKIHSDARDHECAMCGRRFKRSGDLNSHVKTHTGVRPFKCYMCEKDYTSHSGLRKHFKSHFKNDFE